MPSSDSKGQILVIDDDPDIRDALVDTLEDEGYQVVQKSGGQEALSYLRSNPAPGMIFIDWNMAPMNATQFMEEFCKDPALCDIPVVLLTADVHASQKALTSRYHAFVTKPVNLDTLFATIERFLGARKG
jgi:CheY-like chemotaxis protein